jgi:capsular exopolysaccharide synthesis family protein
MSEQTRDSGGELGRFLQVIARRRWVVVIVALVIAIAATAWSIVQSPTYGATSKVLISSQNIPLAVTAGPDTRTPEDPVRVAATEAQVARLRIVIDRARVRAGITNETTDQIRAHTSVGSGEDSDLLTITVTDGDAARASRLADAIANEYVTYRTQLDVAKVEKARNDILDQLDKLRAAGTTSGTYYDTLRSNAQQLTTLATVGATNYNVVESAGAADKVSPKPVRDGIVAVVVGLIVGLAVAFLADRLDRRVRSVGEVEEHLAAPLLARVDAGGRSSGGGRRMIAALDRPQGSAAESFRMLRANFEFTNAVADAGVVMVTSARPQEGKSTVAANLAATLAASGRKVALVDLDIRRPTLHTFFGIAQIPGATQVAAGTVRLDDVIAEIDLPRAADALGEGSGAAAVAEGRLWVVPAGVQPPNPGQFIASRAIAMLVQQLRGLAELVIVDVPPMLACGDAKSLAPAIDAMLLVVRMAEANRAILQELRREMEATPCTTLGFVVTGAAPPVSYGYYVRDDGTGGSGGDAASRPSLRAPG